jgi:hypothetical protein
VIKRNQFTTVNNISTKYNKSFDVHIPITLVWTSFYMRVSMKCPEKSEPWQVLTNTERFFTVLRVLRLNNNNCRHVVEYLVTNIESITWTRLPWPTWGYNFCMDTGAVSDATNVNVHKRERLEKSCLTTFAYDP